jgi:hypothetical protein
MPRAQITRRSRTMRMQRLWAMQTQRKVHLRKATLLLHFPAQTPDQQATAQDVRQVITAETHGTRQETMPWNRDALETGAKRQSRVLARSACLPPHGVVKEASEPRKATSMLRKTAPVASAPIRRVSRAGSARPAARSGKQLAMAVRKPEQLKEAQAASELRSEMLTAEDRELAL